MKSVLLIEDDEDLAFAFNAILSRYHYEVRVVADATSALEAVSQSTFDLVLLDLGLPDADGMEVLATLKEEDAVCPVVVLTGRDNATSAVKALRLGATDYLTKPITSEVLINVVSRAIENSSLRRLLEAMQRMETERAATIGESPIWRQAVNEIEAAATAPRTPVLLTGETGTGKEVCSRLLHGLSKRASGSFVTVNAACFPPTLLESELFGHEAGAFTDARNSRRGLFELASGGILFLDEVAELPREIQAKLLRVLEGHPFRRVGGEREIHSDVRIISATNRDLSEEVKLGRFREDLYHRLKVIEIHLPALRKRTGDISRLALHFVAKLRGEVGKPHLSISRDALEKLEQYAWPGNVRELRNVIERALVLARGAEIKVCDLPIEISGAVKFKPNFPSPCATPSPLEAVIKQHILATYKSTGENLTRAASILAMSRVALRRHLREYGIKPVTS
ncbi:MAG: sigma-54 dependent transcriptional regulator [Acidobacteriota bacterium]